MLTPSAAARTMPRPPDATDSGTDAYQVELGGQVSDGDIIRAFVDSANDTSSPTLELTKGTPTGAKSIVTLQGSAFANMLENRPHEFMWDETNDRFVVLDPGLAVEAWHEVGDSGEPSYKNNWVDYGSGGWGGAAFLKDHFGFVHLSGLVKDGTTNATIFTLPAGYRPDRSQNRLFVVYSANTHARVNVNANGDVDAAANTSSNWVSLNGITFRAG